MEVNIVQQGGRYCQKCGKNLDLPEVEGIVWSHSAWWCVGCFADDMEAFKGPKPISELDN